MEKGWGTTLKVKLQGYGFNLEWALSCSLALRKSAAVL